VKKMKLFARVGSLILCDKQRLVSLLLFFDIVVER
jgi:hypothetical protein